MRNENYLFYISLLFLILLNTSFTWPLDDAKITSTFGEARWDHFHDGIDLVSQKDMVKSAADGELVYCWNRSIFPVENYPGAGNYKILRHKEGVYTLYMHLADGMNLKSPVRAGEELGVVGNTGHSLGKHLHISFLEISSRKSMNPLNYFPKFEDMKAPVIGEVFIRIDDKYFVIKDKSKVRLTRHYPLLIDIYDSISGSERLGISRMEAFFNGKMIFQNDYSAINYTKNGLTISQHTYQDLFDIKGYYKVSKVIYKDGLNQLRIVAQDLNGNKSEKEISFEVKLDLQ